MYYYAARATVLATALAFLFSDVASGNPALEGYANYEAFARSVAELDASEVASVTSLGKTFAGRDIYVITVGAGKQDEKPAILVIGNVHAPQVAGSELAMRMARQLVEEAVKDGEARQRLDYYTWYIIPRPSPDATEKNFSAPYREQAGNTRRADDDRDAESGEDPPDDLNGDGWITMMRVEDAAGEYIPHPDDPRVMIRLEAAKNERGKYRMYVEGRDDDADEQFNEDAADGVALNRNFTFQYPYFKSGAGPHQVSEIESRAIADFCFARPNIALMFSFSPEDNLMHPWKAPDDQGRIKTGLLKPDATYQDFMASRYRELLDSKDAPSSPKGEGSLSEWAYFHYGRWSLAARGWWPSKVEAKTEERTEEEKSDEPAADEFKKDEAEQKNPDSKSKENRGASELNQLRWLAEQGIDGFVPWTAVEHPDFSDKKVEVGGLRPFYALNPPAKLLDDLATKHLDYVQHIARLLPSVKIHDTNVDSLGGGIYRLTITILNEGYLPSTSEMGRIGEKSYPLQIELRLPDGVNLVQGFPRTRISPLAGGGSSKHSWLIRSSKEAPGEITVRVWAPAVRSDERQLELK